MSALPHHDVASDRHRTPATAVKTTPKPFTVTPEDPASLISTWYHRAWVATGCTTILLCLASSIIGSRTWLEPTVAAFAGYLFADFGTGVYHWAIDNYGSPQTPIFGPQIDGFQGHHMNPFTKVQFAKNLYELGLVITIVMVPVMLMMHDRPVVMAFFGVGSGCVMFSQQFHAWAHGTKNKLPQVVLLLQDAGVLLSRSQHAAHHRRPFNSNYCIVSGMWNRVLDKYKVFEGLEMVVFQMFGVRPRSWVEEAERSLNFIVSIWKILYYPYQNIICSNP